MIKTWQQRCEEHPDHEGIVTEQMIRDRMQEEIDELRQALNVDAVNMSQERVDETAKGEHEPVAWSDIVSDGGLDPRNAFDTAPPKKEWVGLTDEEIKKIAKKHKWHEGNVEPHLMPVFRSLEAKLREKNT